MGIAVSNSLEGGQSAGQPDPLRCCDHPWASPRPMGASSGRPHLCQCQSGFSGFRTGLLQAASTPTRTSSKLLTVPSLENAAGACATGSMKPQAPVHPWPFRSWPNNIGYIAALTAESGPFTRRNSWLCALTGSTSTRRPPSPCSRDLIEAQAVGRQAREQDGARPDAQLPGPYFNTPVSVLEPALKAQLQRARCRPEDLPTIPSLRPLYWKQRSRCDFLPLQEGLNLLVPGWNRSA